MHPSRICAAAIWLAAWTVCGDAMAVPAPLAVQVENRTRTTVCAEEDNVSLVLRGARVGRFTVEATQPAYLASIVEDITAPDFSGCDFSGSGHPTDPAFSFSPRRVVLHDGPRWKIVALTLPSFWRPHEVPVQVGPVKDRGFHLIQVFAKGAKGSKPKEAIVLYPADGYWRLKPLPLPRFGDGVYGSSFVMGPIEERGRPAANITSIVIVPQPLSFRLTFGNGSEARVRVAEISMRRTALEVTMKPATSDVQPFAVLRSMYIAHDNADMSEVSWRSSPKGPRQTLALPDLSTLQAPDLRFGRSVPSRHNTSAPDIRFSGFVASQPH